MPSSKLIPEAWRLVAGQLAQLLYPAVLASVSLVALSRATDIHISSWLIVATSLASVAPFHICRSHIREMSYARKAARLGAALPPQWAGKQIGNVDLLRALKAVWVNGYISKCVVVVSCASY